MVCKIKFKNRQWFTNLIQPSVYSTENINWWKWDILPFHENSKLIEQEWRKDIKLTVTKKKHMKDHPGTNWINPQQVMIRYK